MDSLSPHKGRSVQRGASSESGWMAAGGGGERRRQLTKVLFHVNIQSSLGAVHVMMSPESTIGELMQEAIGIYVKEKRRPLLASSDPACYELHYSQFSLESESRFEARGEINGVGVPEFLFMCKACTLCSKLIFTPVKQ